MVDKKLKEISRLLDNYLNYFKNQNIYCIVMQQIYYQNNLIVIININSVIN